MEEILNTFTDKLNELNKLPNELYSLYKEKTWVSSRASETILNITNDCVSYYKPSNRNKQNLKKYLTKCFTGSQSVRGLLDVIHRYITEENSYYQNKIPLGSAAGILVLNFIMVFDTTCSWVSGRNHSSYKHLYDSNELMKNLLGPNLDKDKGVVPKVFLSSFYRIVQQLEGNNNKHEAIQNEKDKFKLPTNGDERVLGWLYALGLLDTTKAAALESFLGEADYSKVSGFVEKMKIHKSSNSPGQGVLDLEKNVSDYITENLRCLLVGVVHYMEVFNVKTNGGGSSTMPITKEKVTRNSWR